MSTVWSPSPLPLGRAIVTVVEAQGVGAALAFSLAAAPGTVRVVLGVQAEKLCMSFGGRVRYRVGHSWTATGAPAPPPSAPDLLHGLLHPRLALPGICVVVVPPLVGRRLRIALGGVFPLLLPAERGDVEVVPRVAHLLVATGVNEV